MEREQDSVEQSLLEKDQRPGDGERLGYTVEVCQNLFPIVVQGQVWGLKR